MSRGFFAGGIYQHPDDGSFTCTDLPDDGEPFGLEPEMAAETLQCLPVASPQPIPFPHSKPPQTETKDASHLKMCKYYLRPTGCKAERQNTVCDFEHIVLPSWRCNNCQEYGHRFIDCPVGHCNFYRDGHCEHREKYGSKCPLSHSLETKMAAPPMRVPSISATVQFCSNCQSLTHPTTECTAPCIHFISIAGCKNPQCKLWHPNLIIGSKTIAESAMGAKSSFSQVVAGAVAGAAAATEKRSSIPAVAHAAVLDTLLPQELTSESKGAFQVRRCKFLQRGHCNRGTYCRYSHDDPRTATYDCKICGTQNNSRKQLVEHLQSRRHELQAALRMI